MDYKKKYKEILERARKLQENSNGMILKKWLWDIFPELAESEDERIRKALIDLIKSKEEDGYMVIKNFSTGSILAWLEKQGEQKSTDNSTPQEAMDIAVAKCFDEQKSIIEMKSAEERLGVSSKEYNEIVNECLYGEQKSTEWSEEDECYMSECISAIATKDTWTLEEKRKIKHWLKSLKERIGG